MNRRALAALLASALILACRIHVTIWVAGCQVARPPVAGLLLVAVCAVIAVLVLLIIRALRDQVPQSRPKTA